MNSCACAARAAASISSCERAGRAVGDVARDGVVEQHRLLRHDADLRAQRRERHVADVDAVDEDGPAGHVVEPRNQVDQRRLSRAAQPDDRDHLPGARPRTTRRAASYFAWPSSYAKLTFSELDRCRESAAAAARPAAPSTSECVSSISKMRSEAAIACCRFVFTRLNFLIGVYIMNAAKMNAAKLPCVSRPLRDLPAAVPDQADHRQPAEKLHQRRQHRDACS